MRRRAGGSGLASCVGSTADGERLDTSKLGDVSVTVTARDHAGNQTVVTNTVTVVDETKPTVTIASPPDGAVYARGEHVARGLLVHGRGERLGRRVL